MKNNTVSLFPKLSWTLIQSSTSVWRKR